MSSEQIDKGYEPRDVEARWYDTWEKDKMFAASVDDGKPPYSIVIPPPNVTGVLHMGHALNITLQDILCRYRRQRGDSVLWMPGTDHAGIATQNVVEKKLAAEGVSRHQLGREEFIEAVWEWRRESGSAIINQLKRIGACCDWDRERFTMDEGLSIAVRKVFVTLYEEGLIYRGNYIINWCPRCHTALSDLEVDHEDHDGRLYHILYPFPGEKDGLIVATTRPETMLGDTAVAINPADERYEGLAHTSVTLPLMDREIPIIKDDYVDMTFGTGGLKVTPAHDPNDFEIGKRHDLPSVKVIGDDGKMTEEARRFAGLDRFAAREAVVKALEAEGLLKKIDAHAHSVGHCYRCKTVIEPNLSKQWFVSAKPLAEKAIDAVRTGKTKIVPEIWTKTYYDWMENIRDWCISRQIWWGHRIPAWTCDDCGEVMVAMEAPQTCTACGGSALTRETDVLDTWFSSALWPFSTMGWPENTDLLKKFYPTSVLVTGFDILFFWVARMMMMGIHFMKDIPFKDVYVHALVRDEDGKKMSKSKGNVIDPLTVIEEYGTDAFRFTLAAFAAQGRDIKMSEKRVAGYRNFINKIWNAARFCLMHITAPHTGIDIVNASLFDRWILSRFNHVTDEVRDALDDYRFNDAAGTLYQFVWHEFCDWYLEAVKPTLYGHEGEEKMNAALGVLYHVLKGSIVLLHPFIPFVTEEIWHKLPGTEGSVMDTAFPADCGDENLRYTDDRAEADVKIVTGVITGIRNIRGEMNIQPSMYLKVMIQCPEEAHRQVMEGQKNVIVNLARLESMEASPGGRRPKAAASAIVDGATVFVSLEGIIDFKKEAQRLTKEMAKLEKELSQLSKKLNNEAFLAKAPADVVAGVREKETALAEKHRKLNAGLEKIRDLDS